MIPTAAGCFNGMLLVGPKEFNITCNCFGFFGYLPIVRSSRNMIEFCRKLFCLGFGINTSFIG